MEQILIYVDEVQKTKADALIGAPVGAKRQQGLIQMWSVAPGQQGKYILHTLAQRALVELEDETIPINRVPAGIIFRSVYRDMQLSFPEGVLLVMDNQNRIRVFAHEGIHVTGMLREFHRYATRMIRLDVR